jgi:hypothetical protein
MNRALILFVATALSSCATYLPVFESLVPPMAGEHLVGTAGYVSNGYSYVGGSVFHSVGMTDQWAWSSQGALGLGNPGYIDDSEPVLSAYTGPKWVNYHETFGFSLPVGFFSPMSELMQGGFVFGTLPTVYFNAFDAFEGEGMGYARLGLFPMYVEQSIGYRWTAPNERQFISLTFSRINAQEEVAPLTFGVGIGFVNF